jgi:putative ABC transport system permease protein
MSTLLQDVRYALRSFTRNVGFTTAAVLSLAIGIGATAVIYSIVDHIVLRPLNYTDVDRLVVVRLSIKEVSDAYPTLPAGAMHFAEWQRRCTVCAGVGAIKPIGLTLTGGANAERLGGARVSASLFQMLGVRPALGRLFSSAEDRPGQNRVAVISDALWRGRFGADPSVIGRTVTLNDASYVVIGVLPASFRLPKGNELGDLVKLYPETDAFVPLALTPQELASPGAFDYAVIARVKPGVSRLQLAQQLDAIEAGIAERLPNRMTIHTVITPLQEQVVGASRRALLFLLAAAGGVLLLVCINLATLMLARNTDRLREAAVRVALGARRARLIRQALTECVLLALAGGAVGVALAYWGLDALLAAAPASLPRTAEVHIDAGVLLVAFLVSAAAGVLFGVLPALRFGDSHPADLIKSGGRTSTEGRRGRRSRSLLVGAQVALSTVMLIATALFIASFARVLGVNKGFDADNVLALDVVLPAGRYNTDGLRAQYYQQALASLRAVPGVTSTAVTNALPLEGESFVNDVAAEGDTRPSGQRPLANLRFVTADYFATMGTPIKLGRALNESDGQRSVVVVSQRAAAVLWPGANPIGKRITAGDNAAPAEVVGVVADVETNSLEQPGSLVVYEPLAQWPPFTGTILVRTTVDPSQVTGALRARLRSIDATVPIANVRTMAQVVSATVAQRRFEMLLLSLFAVIALLTAIIGIYGTTSYSVARRANEIGIRLVLGAHAADIRSLVMRDGLAPVAAGLVAGLGAALLLGRAFASMLFEVRPTDPVTLASVTLLLAAAAVAACYAPARRATSVDPIESLRFE